jgi:RNA polymerase sigma-B factor
MTTGPASRNVGTDHYADIDALFIGMAEADDDRQRRERRCEIIARCLPLADHIAYRFVGRGEPSEDLIQVARLGLIKTVDRYDPAKGRFLPFAVRTIAGEVRRYFRDNAWGMHVPRRIKETNRRVRGAVDPLCQRLGRTPTAADLAAELHVDLDEISRSIRAAYAYRPMSLDVQSAGAEGRRPHVAVRDGFADLRYECVEDTLVLAGAIHGLSRREQVVLRMRFCDCMTQTQIAQQLGVSQVHVSRLLTATLDNLRTHLIST